MSDPNPLPQISEQEINPVPVFNCHVILGKPDESGKIYGRTANLHGISASGSTERDVLTAISRQFKSIVLKHTEEKQPVPFLDQADTPQPGEVERFIPVHL